VLEEVNNKFTVAIDSPLFLTLSVTRLSHICCNCKLITYFLTEYTELVPGLCKRSLVNKLIFDPYPDKGNRSVFYSHALVVGFRVELLHERIEGGASNLFLKFLIQTYVDATRNRAIREGVGLSN
jgi:hypothetical protein